MHNSEVPGSDHDRKLPNRVDSALTVEHSEPFARDFNLSISSAGISVRLALFNEEDGSTCLRTLREAGAKVCRTSTRGGGIQIQTK